MVKEVLHKPYEIEYRSYDRFPKKLQHNSFFALIFVAEGTGIQTMNGHTFQYKKGNLFLLTPQDSYSFTIETRTQFFTLKFNSYFVARPGEKEWADRMNFILNNASHRPGCILKNKVDKPLMASLIMAVVDELSNEQIYATHIIKELINAIILIVARNIALKLPKKLKENTGEAILEILDHVQKNIFVPENLKANSISKTLGISLSYLGRYFKKQTGETLQQYIVNYKLRMVELRLLHTDKRINEIVYEFNFSDESHLNRLFKKYKGVSPTEYRKIHCA